jgi:hypothetical protein
MDVLTFWGTIMSDVNRISASLSDQAMQEIIKHLDAIDALLTFNVTLKPGERRDIPGIGTARGAMDEAFQMQMAAHPELIPSYVDMKEVARDRELRSRIGRVLARLDVTWQKLSDAHHCAGADNLAAYRNFYQNVQLAVKHNVPGAKAVLDDLKRFFTGGGGRKKKEEPEGSET